MFHSSKFIVLLLAGCTLLSGCASEHDILSKVWFYTFDDTKSHASSGDPTLTPINFINLQSDGHYTADLDGFQYGTWAMGGGGVILTGSDKKIRHIEVQKVMPTEITVDVQPGNNDKSSYRFEGSKNAFPDEENPFSLANNRWRIKATHKESDKEIVDRLKNHFRYWEKYFAWGLKVEKTSLDVRSLRGPLKIYGNGFELVPLEDWSPEWADNFYDQQDRERAWKELEYFFIHERIAWAKSDNKFKMFISAFQQLQNKMD